MENIRYEVIEKISEIGAGETLLIFTEDQSTFIKYEAKLNGQIQMVADNGNIEVQLTRDQIEAVLTDFGVIEQIKELPLKTIKLNADGQFQVDDDPDTFLKADADGIAERTMVPVAEQLKSAIKSILPNIEYSRARDLDGDGNHLVWDLQSGFQLEIKIHEPSALIELAAIKSKVVPLLVDEFTRDYGLDDLSPLLKIKVERDTNYGFKKITFNIVLISQPFIGQHAARALGELGVVMNLWNEYEKDGGQSLD